MEENHLYAGPLDEMRRRIDQRKAYYSDHTADEWQDAPAKFFFTENGEEILEINGLEVMAAFETPYMHKLAEIVTRNGGDVLNIGFGLGIADQFIESFRNERAIGYHHIVELNTEVYQRAVDWRNKQAHKDLIVLHHGDWKSVLSGLAHKFDGILYDGFPITKKDLCRDFIPFLEHVLNLGLIKEGGLLTFFFDSYSGYSDEFIEYAKQQGIKSLTYEKVAVTSPQNRSSNTWESDFFLAPILADFS